MVAGRTLIEWAPLFFRLSISAHGRAALDMRRAAGLEEGDVEGVESMCCTSRVKDVEIPKIMGDQRRC